MKCAALFALLAFASAGDPTAVDFARYKFLSLEPQLWKNVTDPEWTQGGVAGDIELTKAFVSFDENIASVPRTPRPPLKSWLWMRAVGSIQIIDGFYTTFLDFVNRQVKPGLVTAPSREWLDLAESVLKDPSASVADAVNKLHDLLEHGDMFRSVLQERYADICELQLSPHQLIYDMYNTIALTEIKGYAMMQFSWMLLRIYGKGNFTQEASLTRRRYTERTIRIAEAAKAALSMAHRDIYRCDPPEHVKGETYEEVTRLLQGYIENEVDMNADKTCKENCAYYTLTKNYGCFDDMYCAHQPTCKGRIINCKYVDSDMWICPASHRSTRRYEWIEYENERTLGRKGYCKRGTSKVDSWWRIPFHCSYCFCLCEDQVPIAERTFSLREATSNIDLNKVVTGLRLVKHGRVFHLQVSEGRLGERGAVTPGSWVPINKFDVDDPDVREGVDYHTLSYEQRAMDLDELDSPFGHVMTGVRFRMMGAHLHFEIRSTRFNYTTGRLSPEKSQWVSNDNTDGAEIPRSKLTLINPDIPIYSHNLPVDSKHDQFVEFTNSDLDADAAQSTVPFIDIQPVEPLKGASLISGAGMIHRGIRGSGGFIAPKLFTYDYSRHVKAELAPETNDGETPDFMPVAAY